MKAKMTLFYLTIAAAIVLAGLTIYQAWDKVQSDKIAESERLDAIKARSEASDARKEAKKANDKFEKSQKEIAAMNLKSLDKADNIIESNQVLINAQQETLKKVIGFGHPKIYPILNPDNGKLRFIIKNTTSYPLKNVKIHFIEYDKTLRSKFRGMRVRRSELANYTSPDYTFPRINGLHNEVLIVNDHFDAPVRAFYFYFSCDHANFASYVMVYRNTDGTIGWSSLLYELSSINDQFILLEESPKGALKGENWDEYMVLGNILVEQDL